jgi:hypothetical protein
MRMADNKNFAEMTKEEQLKEVNNAIYAVLAGGQSYSIGSRSLTRADLSLLKSMREELEAEITRDDSSHLLDNTFVAMFTGR